MTLKLLPRENSIFTSANAEAFFRESQITCLSGEGTFNLGIYGNQKYRDLAAYNPLDTD